MLSVLRSSGGQCPFTAYDDKCGELMPVLCKLLWSSWGEGVLETVYIPYVRDVWSCWYFWYIVATEQKLSRKKQTFQLGIVLRNRLFGFFFYDENDNGNDDDDDDNDDDDDVQARWWIHKGIFLLFCILPIRWTTINDHFCSIIMNR